MDIAKLTAGSYIYLKYKTRTKMVHYKGLFGQNNTSRVYCSFPYIFSHKAVYHQHLAFTFRRRRCKFSDEKQIKLQQWRNLKLCQQRNQTYRWCCLLKFISALRTVIFRWNVTSLSAEMTVYIINRSIFVEKSVINLRFSVNLFFILLVMLIRRFFCWF